MFPALHSSKRSTDDSCASDAFDGWVQVRLQVWDTAGQERFQNILPAYYKGMSQALSPDSVEALHSCQPPLRRNTGIHPCSSAAAYVCMCCAIGAHGVMLTYDVTDEKSFLDVGQWMRNIETYASDHIQKIIVANKCDMASERVRTKPFEPQSFALHCSTSHCTYGSVLPAITCDVFRSFRVRPARNWQRSIVLTSSNVRRRTI